ncbi:putative F-box protein At3g25750 [Actinidia eriantha]|uniref:putative F-box protein At3g25750 n=1 Tax=Actinidia eriantha TaxID=165200 RepID=UPI00258EC75F|nr:putative F-box protein At3g25750 [Actinidia eriantha]
MDSYYRDWAWLPQNLLASIEERLGQFSDFICFIAVCGHWRLVALENNNSHKHRLNILKTCHNKLPMLMIETKENHPEKRVLFSVTEGITYEVQLPSPCNNMFFSSSLGWLFTIDKTMTITLLNPFTSGVVTLPILNDPSGEFEYWVDNHPDYFVTNGILSSDPLLSPNNYEIVVIYGGLGRLASLRSDNDSWNFINLGQHYVVDDIIYHKGQVFAVDSWSKLVRIEIASGATNYRVMTRRRNRCAQVAYLVESQEGDLLMVQRFWKNRKTFEFKVFKLVYLIGKAEEAVWAHVKNIGDQTLFLGDNHSVSVSTMEFPGCQPNCIYYTDQIHNHIPPYVCHGVDDSGVFNLEDGSIHSHYVPDPSKKQILPPIWFVPKLKGN